MMPTDTPTKEAEMPRTILIHLNVTPDPADDRTADEIADALLAALEVGLEGEPTGMLASGNGDQPVALALVEEI